MRNPRYSVRLIVSLLAGGTLAAGCNSRGATTDSGIDDAAGMGSLVGWGPPTPLPSDFTAAEVGGYKLGIPVPNDGETDGGLVGNDRGCNMIVGVVRDFRGQAELDGHPDFEAYHGNLVSTGLIGAALGADRKPVYGAHCDAATADPVSCPYGQQVANQAAFDQWYRNTDGVNQAFRVYFLFQPNRGVMTFQGDHFFPVDRAGWGNSGQGDDAKEHNFGFTTEVHTRVKYQGGEHFAFIGDDDLWVFVNGRLVIDLGGVHPQITGTVDLDEKAADLGLTRGNTYDLDLFHAERHTESSDFRVDTNFLFVDCGSILP